jgi:hypothetical protein
MTTRIVTDANGRKHITNEPLLHPPQRTWVGLTDEEVKKIVGSDRYTDLLKEVVQIVEAKLRSKNSG